MARISREVKLGQVLVQNRWCTLQQVNEALLLQRRLKAENRKPPLGVLLLERGTVSEENLRRALAELGVLRLYCPNCRVTYVTDVYQSAAESTCATCKGQTFLDNRLEETGPEAGASAADAERYDKSETPVRAAVASEGPQAPPVALAGRPEAAARDSCVGRVLGGCEILEKIAHGGMGVVYKAMQLNLGRTVAVKVLSADLASDATFVRRFLQEARAVAQLNHGNIVHVNDVGEHQGIYYFVMEYVDGENLKDILKRDIMLEISWALEIAIQVCHALRHAHSRGIIHRDIKPENIMITRERCVKLADLGLARRVDSEHKLSVTHSGSVLGTPFYMAPEQAKDFSRADARSDIYSLGVTLYRMITGKVPFFGRTPIEVMIRAIEGRKLAMHDLREGVPPEVEAVVDKMMHRDPDERFQHVEEVMTALTRALVALPAAQPVPAEQPAP
jgi:predicted Ser/Thr protein kinase